MGLETYHCLNELWIRCLAVPMAAILKIYFQDTGGIHSNYDDVDEVVKRYREILTNIWSVSI